MEQPRSFLLGNLRYKKGDATIPVSAGHRIIIHICNDTGLFGAGFSGAIIQRWPIVKDRFRRWYISQEKFIRGEIQAINVQSDTTIVNMIAQNGTKRKVVKKDLVDYEALEKCLTKVASIAKENGSSIHCPRIGCGLAGALNWGKIEELIKKTFIDKNINVTVYDLEEK